MKHTPGPWTLHQNGDGSYTILGKKINEKEFQWIISFIQNGEYWIAEQIANIKLMTAAPIMLKELQNVLKYNKDVKGTYQISPSLIYEIEQVIKKATE